MDREKLIAILQSTRAGLADKDIVEHASSFIFANEQVLAFNGEISVHYPLPLDFEGVVPADKLLAFLDKGKKDEIKLEASGNELLLKCGRAKAGIVLSSEIPEYLESLKIPRKGWAPIPDGFVDALQFCFFSVSRDMTKPVLTCVHIVKDIIESCDAFRATRRILSKSANLDELLIPAPVIKYLRRFGITEYANDNTWIHFRNEDEAILSCRLFQGQYPALKELLNFDIKGTSISFPDSLGEMLDGAGVFADAEFDTDRSVAITVQDGKLIVRAEGGEGWFEQSARAKGIKDLNFTIHPGFLQEVLKHSGEAKLTERTILFKGENFVHVVSL